jgi:NAD(P) transhydrogenase subunit alpha
VAVPRERAPGEERVALVADSVKRLLAKGIVVTVETGAGAGAKVGDEEYVTAGAEVVPSRDALLAAADVVLKVRAPTLEEVAALREGSVLVALLSPRTSPDLVRALAARRITAIAVDLIPRTTAAQAMDVLSSQATAAGYEAVLLAASALPRFFPMLMTAAGTIPPARVLVLGAGVAGLTAIGAARRLGAVVEGFDVRKAAREQVESLGAKFVDVESAEDAEDAGGYAVEISAAHRERQAEVIARHLARSDVCIASALVPGRRAPVLVTEAMVRAMRPGSVIVDLAAEQGGNCALTEPGRTVVAHGVTIVGDTNLPSRLAAHASQMYSRNVEKLLLHISREGKLAIDRRDEIMAGAVITEAGEIVHPALKGLP